MRIYYCDKCGRPTEKSNAYKTLPLRIELPSLRKSDGEYIKEILFCGDCYKLYLETIENFLSDSFAVKTRKEIAEKFEKTNRQDCDIDDFNTRTMRFKYTP